MNELREESSMAEIKIRELSIGDWVEIDGEPAKALCLRIAGGLIFKGVSGQMYRCCGGMDFKPIPLTPEILEKNGLEYVDDGNDAVIFLCCDMFWARLCVGDTFWQVGIHSEDRLDAVVCNVKHTHQLQHALRLAGVGKEIEL